MKLASALLALVTLASPVFADDLGHRKTEEILLVASATADLVSTELFLSQGLEEANPFVRNRAARLALKAGATAFTVWAARRLEKGGHDTTARALRWMTIGGWFSATGWNVYVTIR